MESDRGAGAPLGGLLAQPTDPPAPQMAVVGIALKKDKRRKHISDRLVKQAAEAGVELRFVDKEVPLDRQGPFVAILQKVRKPGERGKGRLAAAAVAAGGTRARGQGKLSLPSLPAPPTRVRYPKFCRVGGRAGAVCCSTP